MTTFNEKGFFAQMLTSTTILDCITGAVRIKESSQNAPVTVIYITSRIQPQVIKEVAKRLSAPVGAILESSIQLGNRCIVFRNISTEDMRDYGISAWAQTVKGIEPLL